MPRAPLKHPLELKLELLRLREEGGYTYEQLREMMGIHKISRGVVGRLIYEAKVHLGLRPPIKRKPKKKKSKTLIPSNEPQQKALVDAYLISQKITDARKINVERQDFEAAYAAMEASILRECRELRHMPPGSVIETAWDYNDPKVRKYAERKHLFPSHITTIYVGKDEEADDDYYLQEWESRVG